MTERIILGSILLIIGFILGWRCHPVFWTWMLEQVCSCGSGRKFEDCCYKDAQENE